jgi:predicted RNA-binding protein with PUA-like domain
MRYWLMKSEPSEYSIDDLACDKMTAWTGVRNFQARNFMRDEMRLADRVLFYHSACDEPGIVGVAEVCRAAYPDPTQFDPRSEYYEPASTRDAPRWLSVDVKFVNKNRLISLQEMRKHKVLARMRVLQRGNRLSVSPVEPGEWKAIMDLI